MIKRLVLIWLISVVSGVLLLSLVFMIPGEPVRAHLAQDKDFISGQGNYPNATSFSFTQDDKSFQLDFFTDRLMLTKASYEGEESPLEKGLMVYSAKGGVDTASTNKQAYPWYWHGYLVWLRPVLCVMTFRQFQTVNLVLILLLCSAIITGLWKRECKPLVFAFLLTVFVLHPYVLSRSVQYVTVFYVTGAECLYLIFLKRRENLQRIFLSFFLSGILTAYFDLLTYPVAAFGVPAVILCFLLQRQGQATKRILKNLLFGGVLFLAGYGSMLSGKWLTTALLLRHDSLSDAVEHILYHSQTENSDLDIHRVDAVVRNLKVLNHPIYGIAFVLTVVVCCALFFFHWRKRKQKPNLQMAVPYLFLAAVPFLWWSVFPGHSFIHYWFTYRGISITIFSICAAIAPGNMIYYPYVSKKAIERPG